MEEKRLVILFLLLVTLSSIMGSELHFTFSKEAYNAVQQGIMNVRLNYGISLTDADPIKLINMNENLEMVRDSDEDIQEDIPSGLHMGPKNPKTVVAGVSGVQGPEPLSYMSILFTKVENPRKKGEITIFGNLIICFEDGNNDLYQSCLSTFMFSPPKTPEDVKYAEQVAEQLNPLSKDQVQNILQGKSFKWALSSLEKIVSSKVKKFGNTPYEGQTVFALKPIIVDDMLMKAYFHLANPSGTVEKVGSLDEQFGWGAVASAA